MEPEFFFNGGIFAEPVLEIFIRCLPVFPDSGGGFDGASFGAEIVDI